MKQRKLGPFSVSAIGFGCMNVSHGYGPAIARDEAVRVLRSALDAGYTLFDTATMYGQGANEMLVGEALGSRRDSFLLASKCGMARNAEGVREINGRPEVLRRQCDESLRRLRTEVIDLYYLHRRDRNVPIEESVGALGDLVRAGKVRSIGLSEVSAHGLRRAHAEFPVTAVQSEYSLWTRNPEIAVIDACRELAVAFVAFSPLGRGFLAGGVRDISSFGTGDLRPSLPRFSAENFPENLKLLDRFCRIAERAGCRPSLLALAWLLARGDDILPIPGTTSIDHLAENAAAADVALDETTIEELDTLFRQGAVAGARYPPSMQADSDMEEFAAAENDA